MRTNSLSMTSTDGPTSETDPDVETFEFPGRHTCELVENHQVLIELTVEAAGKPAVLAETDKAARELMDAWCTAHQVEPINVKALHLVPGPAVPSYAIGVSWQVYVGKATVDPNQGVPGVLDNWTWSGRVEWWRYFFGRFEGGRQGRRLTELRKGDTGRVIQFPSGVTTAITRTASPTLPWT